MISPPRELGWWVAPVAVRVESCWGVRERESRRPVV